MAEEIIFCPFADDGRLVESGQEEESEEEIEE